MDVSLLSVGNAIRVPWLCAHNLRRHTSVKKIKRFSICENFDKEMNFNYL